MKKEPAKTSTETQKTDQPVQADDQIADQNTYLHPKGRIRFGLALTMAGYLMFLLGARPSLFGLDRSRVIGFVQISVFLIGLGIIVLGSYLTLNAFWAPGTKTIAADVGSRVISTGYVICVFTAMADIFGLGSHRLPNVFFGPLQARGVAIGMATIALGFLMLIRYKRSDGTKQVVPKDKDQAKEQKLSGRQGLDTAQAG